MRELVEALSLNDTSALDSIKKVSTLVRDADRQRQLQKIASHIDDFDFDSALELVRSFIRDGL